MRAIAGDHGSPADAVAAFRSMTAERRLVHPISVAQLGLGGWQLAAADARWLELVTATVDWILGESDAEGRIAFEFAYPHTFDLPPPWYSAMAQGEAASLLVRAAVALERPELTAAAERTASSLLDGSSPVIAVTPEGVVLQEYPTDPPSHVLNGWIFALWGLYDVALAGGAASAAARAGFADGVTTLIARLPLYEAGWKGAWSRYDLFPHRIVHVTSPFYHRLHVEQLRALHQLQGEPLLSETADRWERGLDQPLIRAQALSRKVAFRVLNPRRKAS
jgi:heparosan-N-sulfate-glucuronate 5-epimerase